MVEILDKLMPINVDRILFLHTAIICSLEETGTLAEDEEIKQIYKNTKSKLYKHLIAELPKEKRGRCSWARNACLAKVKEMLKRECR